MVGQQGHGAAGGVAHRKLGVVMVMMVIMVIVVRVVVVGAMAERAIIATVLTMMMAGDDGGLPMMLLLVDPSPQFPAVVVVDRVHEPLHIEEAGGLVVADQVALAPLLDLACAHVQELAQFVDKVRVQLVEACRGVTRDLDDLFVLVFGMALAPSPAAAACIRSRAGIPLRGGSGAFAAFHHSGSVGPVATPASAPALAAITSSVAVIPATSSVSIIVTIIIPPAPVITTRGSGGGLLLPATTVLGGWLVRVIPTILASATVGLKLLGSRTRRFGWTVVFRIFLRNVLCQRCLRKDGSVAWRFLGCRSPPWFLRRHWTRSDQTRKENG